MNLEHIPGQVKFLVCVDASEECKAALKFACMRAKNSNGLVLILYVVEPNDMQHFAGVEKVMEREADEEAERVLSGLQKETFQHFAIKIETRIAYGSKYASIVNLMTCGALFGLHSIKTCFLAQKIMSS